MARIQSNRQSCLCGSFANRSGFVAKRLLIGLVILAAFEQAIPAVIAVPRAGVAASRSEASIRESLTSITHTVYPWMTEPAVSARLTVTKSIDSEPLQGGPGTFDRVRTVQRRLLSREKQRIVDRDSCGFATLVAWNVRLQV